MVSHELEGKCLIVNVEGDILSDTVKDCVDGTMPLFDKYDEELDKVSINLSRVNGIDSMGFNYVVSIYKASQYSDWDLELTGISDQLHKVFSFVQVSELFHVEEDSAGDDRVYRLRPNE